MIECQIPPSQSSVNHAVSKHRKMETPNGENTPNYSQDKKPRESDQKMIRAIFALSNTTQRPSASAAASFHRKLKTTNIGPIPYLRDSLRSLQT